MGVVNLLEAIRMLQAPIRLYNAGSSEMFGSTGTEPATEATVVKPRSPYGIAKATSFWQVAQYREAYAMHAMLRQERPEDLVIATGHTCALEDFVREAFAAAGLDWRWHVRHDPSLARPTELTCSRADASRAREVLGWQARVRMPEVARLMVEARLATTATQRRRRAA